MIKEPLPIDESLPAVIAALQRSKTALLMAPPGSGKTTRVPPALLSALPREGEVVVLEPRRLAARAAAQRVAQELGSEQWRSVTELPATWVRLSCLLLLLLLLSLLL